MNKGPSCLVLLVSAACSPDSEHHAGDAGQVGSDGPITPIDAALPDCAIQRPALLDGYMVRPAWSVAGVDYCVGYPSATILKNPATISVSGVSVDSTNRTVTVTGDSVTLDGYDFSLDGGWYIETQAANTRIVNSKIVNGSIVGRLSSSNLYVGYTVIDANGSQGTVWGGLITQIGSGLTVEYCWLKNAGGDMLQLHSGGGIVIVRYNLLEQAGLLPGAHGDYTQFIGGPWSTTIVFNTIYNTMGTTQGFMVEPDIGSSAGVILGGEIGNNTMVGLGGMNMYVGITIADLVNTFTVHDNYFDPTGVYYFCVDPRGCSGDSSSKTIFTHNVNMVTGALETD